MSSHKLSLAKILGLPVAVLLASALLAACQGANPAAVPAAAKAATTAASAPSTASAPASSAPTTQAAAPAPAAPTAAPVAAPRKPQGTLVVGVSTNGRGALGLPSRHDPDTSFLAANVMESLLRNDANGKLIPNLAEKWEVSPDRTKITFYLRKGVQFHDNWGEFTADDVKFTYEDTVKDGSTAQGKVGFIRLVKRVDVVDKYTVVFNVDPQNLLGVLNAGVAIAPNIQFPITSKKYVESVGLDKAAANAIGTGPWKFVEFKAGSHATFEAVENHWRQTPSFKTLIQREVPEMSSLAAMLRAGDLDMGFITSDYRKELEGAGVKVVVSAPGLSSWFHLGGTLDPSHKNFDPKIPWVGDPKDATSTANALKVRRALNLAVNRQQFMDTILGGGRPSAVPSFIAGTPFYDPAWNIPYDPTQAKQLLKEAGYSDGFSFEMVVVTWTGRPWLPSLTEAVAMQWEQTLGVKIKRTPMEYATMRPMVLNRTLGQRVYGQGMATYVEPHYTQEVAGRTTGPIAILAENKVIDGLVDQIAAEFDDAKRAKVIQTYGKYLLDNYLNVPIGDVPMLIAEGKKIGQYRPPYASTSLREFEYAIPAR